MELPNVNIGTGGAEIGELSVEKKKQGGGRESGSDAWKCTWEDKTNHQLHHKPTLAQGIKFDLLDVDRGCLEVLRFEKLNEK